MLLYFGVVSKIATNGHCAYFSWPTLIDEFN